MKSTLRALALSFLVCAAASAQNAARFPQPKAQFLDQNGYPLAGGLVWTCVSGASCPGTPQATYTTAAGTVANANPIVLDASGSADIWFTPTLLYKVVVQNSSGVTISTTDSLGDGGAAVSNSLAANLASATTGKGAALVAYLPTVTGGAGRTVQAKLGETWSVLDFGAKCDGTTDDSTALQAAFNAGITSNRTIQIPDGKTCAFATPLTLNTGATGGHLRGGFSQGVGMSKLRYTGVSTSPALTLSYPNGSGGWNLVYNPTIESLQLQCGNAAGCGTALALYNASEGVFRDVAVEPDYSDLTHKRWITGVYCLICNVNEFDHPTIAYATRSGIELVATASTIIHSGDFFEDLAHIRISGGTEHTVIEDNWFEMADYGVMFDDSVNGIAANGVYIARNRFLMNAGTTEATWTHQVPVYVNNTASQQVQIAKARVEDNTIFIASALGLASTPNPIAIAYSSSPAVNSLVDFDVRNNSSKGASGPFVAVTNAYGTANTVLTISGNTSVNSTGTAIPAQVTGTASVNGTQNVNGAMALGPNNTNFGQTVTIANGNGGASSLGIWESSTQSSSAPIQIYNASSQLIGGTNYLAGWFGSAYTLTSLSSPTLQRWNVTTAGTESGSNAGSNYSISRYTDAGALIDTPFTINRLSAQTQLSTLAVTGLASTGAVQINGTSGPTWTAGAAAPSGACTTGSLYSNTAGGAASTFYACVSGAWSNVK